MRRLTVILMCVVGCSEQQPQQRVPLPEPDPISSRSDRETEMDIHDPASLLNPANPLSPWSAANPASPLFSN